VTPAEVAPPAEPCVDESAHAWVRGQIGWTIAFGLLITSSLIVMLVDDLSPVARTVGVVAVAAIGLADRVLRPAPGDPPPPRNLAYLAVAVVATGAAVGADPSAAMLLIVLYPQIWMLGGSTRRSAFVSVALSTAFVLGLLTNLGFSMNHAAALTPTLVITSVSSVVMGVWISRIIDQSRERAELISQLESARSELDEAQHARGVLAERERIAREVHDTLAQGFTSIIMLAQAGPAQLATIESVARENLAEARSLVAAFAPVGLSDSSLAEALQRLTSRFSSETGVAVSVTGSLAPLSRDREVVLLRSAQEALANIRRHASAASVSMLLSGATVEIRDDGVGFAPSAAPGFGLSGMRSRVDEVGGSVSVTSSPGSGTTIRVEVPA
jgi:signal transduction histidine kinase